MKIVMLDSMTLGNFDSSVFEKLGEFVTYKTSKTDQVVQRCQDAEIIITNKVVIDSKCIESLPKLKLICITATGTNNIDLEAAKKHNIEVKNVAGYSTFAVAQHTFMLALALLGRLKYYSDYVSNGGWVKSEIFCHLDLELHDLYKKKWGIIGLGSIGKQVSTIAQSFGAKVSYHSTSGNNTQNNIEHKSLEELLKTSDIISIHAPLNDKTYNLITKKQLALIKEKAILLNLGRGGIVNENDLVDELLRREIYFGADVLEKEPMIPNHPLLNEKIKDKILITPHIAWAYNDTKERLISLVVKNIESFLKGA